VLRGHIESFDDDRGDGLVRADNGEAFYFHCVNIADGSRHVERGQTVSLRRAVGHLGHDQALDIVKVHG
jgi:cold shock CspA family protein